MNSIVLSKSYCRYDDFARVCDNFAMLAYMRTFGALSLENRSSFVLFLAQHICVQYRSCTPPAFPDLSCIRPLFCCRYAHACQSVNSALCFDELTDELLSSDGRCTLHRICACCRVFVSFWFPTRYYVATSRHARGVFVFPRLSFEELRAHDNAFQVHSDNKDDIDEDGSDEGGDQVAISDDASSSPATTSSLTSSSAAAATASADAIGDDQLKLLTARAHVSHDAARHRVPVLPASGDGVSVFPSMAQPESQSCAPQLLMVHFSPQNLHLCQQNLITRRAVPILSTRETPPHLPVASTPPLLGNANGHNAIRVDAKLGEQDSPVPGRAESTSSGAMPGHRPRQDGRSSPSSSLRTSSGAHTTLHGAPVPTHAPSPYHGHPVASGSELLSLCVPLALPCYGLAVPYGLAAPSFGMPRELISPSGAPPAAASSDDGGRGVFGSGHVNDAADPNIGV